MTTIPFQTRSRRFSLVRLLVVLFAIHWVSVAVLSAATISYTFVPLGPIGSNNYQYTYYVSGFNFQANQELYVQFDPSVYLSLSNGTAGSDFSVVLSPPNNPPGTPGAYSALAKVDNASLAVPFSVDVSFLAGSGQGTSQFFLLEHYEGAGGFTVLESGETSSVPEPSTALLVLLAMAFMFFLSRLFHRSAAHSKG